MPDRHTLSVCVCVSVCACVCLSDKSRQRRQKQLQLKPTFARILADFVQSAELALKLWQRAVKAPVAVGGVARWRDESGEYICQASGNKSNLYVCQQAALTPTNNASHTHINTHTPDWSKDSSPCALYMQTLHCS